ncbi:MAG: peptide-methionine (S)-S-oxide reductase MsrA [Patescibacteria group bacterium]|jgi:peptide-methionine (S)-S-oxide reductase
MMNAQIAYFAGGCFWGIEEAFRHLPGVVDAESGYIGGHTENPSYEDVCSHTTGHAETVKVTYDPENISYEELLRVFFDIHNPTHVNRQGQDVGDQYRTEIFYADDTQKAAAEKAKTVLEQSGKHDKPIATAITKAPVFYRAEEYHQHYLEKNPGAPCHVPSKYVQHR